MKGDGQVGTVIDSIAYTYDTTWKDKLASYDGNTFFYVRNAQGDIVKLLITAVL